MSGDSIANCAGHSPEQNIGLTVTCWSPAASAAHASSSSSPPLSAQAPEDIHARIRREFEEESGLTYEGVLLTDHVFVGDSWVAYHLGMCLEPVAPDFLWQTEDGDPRGKNPIVAVGWIRGAELKARPGKRGVAQVHAEMFAYGVKQSLRNVLSATHNHCSERLKVICPILKHSRRLALRP